MTDKTPLLEHRPLAGKTLHCKPGYTKFKVRWTQPNIICVAPDGKQERHTPTLAKKPINPHFKGEQ